MKLTQLWQTTDHPTISFELFPARSEKVAGYGLGPDEITAVLDTYQQMGIENILVVRGDEPHGQEDFVPHPESFAHASDLMTFIRPKYDFCIGVAGYPEGHIEAESKDKDLQFLKMKVDNGAEFIITKDHRGDIVLVELQHVVL